MVFSFFLISHLRRQRHIAHYNGTEMRTRNQDGLLTVERVGIAVYSVHTLQFSSPSETKRLRKRMSQYQKAEEWAFVHCSSHVFK